VSDEEAEYGYVAEDRHMAQAFLAGKRPDENFDDGVAVAELLMTAYLVFSALTLSSGAPVWSGEVRSGAEFSGTLIKQVEGRRHQAQVFAKGDPAPPGV
jgi:hypothetical protein